jgi:hypothetical protein
MRATTQWTDVGIFWVTLAGAIVTTLAVAVALFGPRLQQRWRRPELTIMPNPPGMGIPLGSGAGELLQLRLSNRRGRETAYEVEVFVSSSAQGPTALHIFADEDNLNFDNPWAGSGGRTTSSVPSGYSRSVSAAIIEDTKDGPLAYLATVPARHMRTGSLLQDVPNVVYITVAGSNFDAITYRGVLSVVDQTESFDEGPRTVRMLSWTTAPTRWTKPIQLGPSA